MLDLINNNQNHFYKTKVLFRTLASLIFTTTLY